MKRDLKADLKELKELAKSQVIDPISKQLSAYELKAMNLVKDFDLKGRETRDRSRQRLEDFLKQLRRTRSKLENDVKRLVERESKNLNERVTHLFENLKTLSKIELKEIEKCSCMDKSHKTGKTRSTKPKAKGAKSVKGPSSKT